MSSSTNTPRKVVVIGGGPVGCLSAMAMAKMGWNVEVYEGRRDSRLDPKLASGSLRSINLTISSRGITALHAIDPGCADRFLDAAVPLHSRMIHHLNGRTTATAYDRDGQAIHSIDRALLNESLLDDAEATPNIKLLFSHKVLSIDFDGRFMTVRDVNAKRDFTVDFDFCIGADGTYSTVRRQMMRVLRMDFHQEYIDHEYLELRAPAGTPQEPGGQPTFLLHPNHLHVWPRSSFMLIAQPNKNGTFTLTLFAPTAEFDRLRGPEVILPWFRENFPDALEVIGEASLLDCFARNPRCPLINIKANPYHYKDRVIILGDAAHAMVPFYGQGLNCGLQDVHVLAHLILSQGVDPNLHPSVGGLDTRLQRALEMYSLTRREDLHAITDFAMDNYLEMRDTVTKPIFYFKKALDNMLYSISTPSASTSMFSPTLLKTRPGLSKGDQIIPIPIQDPFPTKEPSGWLPMYTMVTFRHDISYGTVKRKAKKQAEILALAANVGFAAAGACALGLTYFSLWNQSGGAGIIAA
ncbi:FAD/NAD-P-binding domain-containing protein [Panus rudis PR-1116 ss-1]|nr:FAD/NAD-P-binding domain-containing protein [Panus rudis PR-1116 ss-1]